CVPVESRGFPFWEVNNPKDIARIEALLSEKGDPNGL
ncbi:MAG: 3-deoxy-manno-octulosonate cytidylyltransferase, partial [Pseudomonadota bacterium]|nr:3-deoxy-manno-octulosonate cytidylyltransferase [Pseudomonadota bacterium]